MSTGRAEVGGRPVVEGRKRSLRGDRVSPMGEAWGRYGKGGAQGDTHCTRLWPDKRPWRERKRTGTRTHAHSEHLWTGGPSQRSAFQGGGEQGEGNGELICGGAI